MGPTAPVNVVSAPAIEATEYDRFQSRLLAIRDLPPQQRGYDFERFLKDLFDAFRLVGEQIDGSFELASETYLLEAKWTSERIGANDLRAFDGKVSDKAAWSRGLFISESGFSEDGLVAFGRGKKVVCMDGLDLYEMLDSQIPFSRIMALKIRRAAETGRPFVRLRDLL